MFNGSNCDQKAQLSKILTEPLNPRGLGLTDHIGFEFLRIQCVLLLSELYSLS